MIAKGFESQEQRLAAHAVRIAGLEEKVARLTRGKKRKAIPNPNRRFMTLSEALATGEAIPEAGSQAEPVNVDSDLESEEVSDVETESDEVAPESPQVTTRSERVIKKNRRYQ